MTPEEARNKLAKVLRKAKRSMERSILKGCYDRPPPVRGLNVKDINGNTQTHAR